MFVRKKYRGRDCGLHMLEDFVDSFTEDALGLRYPLTSLMYIACNQYFEKYPGDHELLWEVEGVGHWYQRIPITRALQRETLKITAVSQNEAKRSTSGEYSLASVPEYEARAEDSQSSEMQLTIDSLKDAFASTSEGHDKTPVSTRTRSSHLKRPKIGKRFQDSEFSSSQGEDEKTPQTSPTASVNNKHLMSTKYHISHATDSETLLDEGPSDDKGRTEEKLPLVSRKKAHFGSSDNVATIPNEERSDSAFPNSVIAEFSEESIPENVSPNTTASLEDQGEEGVAEPQESSAALPQSSLIEVELEDVPFSQNAGQKNLSEEQSEASSEQLDQLTQSTEKTVDSSSEEIEVEVPVVDRRNLRRKAKGHKGPAKKKAKLT
ncbi:FAM169A, partial [Cervus elaphus hippelaphus]